MKYGILALPRMRRKPKALIQSLINSSSDAGKDVVVFQNYQPCDTLILYGWGGARQQASMKRHKGRYVAFDLGYWGRDGFKERNWRVSIDGFHCPGLIARGEAPSPERWNQSGLNVMPAQRNNSGDILLIGNAPKSIKVIEEGWSERKAAEIRKAFPGKRVVYRPKPERPVEHGVRYDRLSKGEIEDAIRSASLVVCRHSNVAVDCCLHGIPVVCEDGAASAIYPNRLKDYRKQPTTDERLAFLKRLAWWQWSINEINQGKFWPWMEAQIELSHH